MSNPISWHPELQDVYLKSNGKLGPMFIGNEVERNKHFGVKTLFVPGVSHSVADILSAAREHNCEHVFFGANYSSPNQLCKTWSSMIAGVVAELPATIDIETSAIESFIALGLHELDNLDVQIRVTIPHVELLQSKKGAGVFVKVDDVNERTNKGVWTLMLSNLLHNFYFTDWDAYRDDVNIG